MPRNRPDPEWLRAIQGDSPLLSPSEKEFIAEVRRLIIHESTSRPSIPTDRHLTNKLSVVKNNFEEIANYLKGSSEHKDSFLRSYLKWWTIRKTSIILLQNIAASLNKDKREFAESRSGSASLSLLGGLISFVPGIGILRIAGGVLMGLGAVATFGVSYLEFVEFRKKAKEAEKIMLQDKTYSVELWNWMNDVSHVQQAYEDIKNMKDGLGLMEIADDLYRCYKKKSMDVQTIIAKILPTMKFSPGLINEIADVIAILLATFMLHDSHSILFNLALETYKAKRILTTAYNVIETTAKMMSAINAATNANFTGFQKTRIGIGIALDIITLIQADRDMKSPSEEAKIIIEVVKNLEKEMDIFEEVYDEVIRV